MSTPNGTTLEDVQKIYAEWDAACVIRSECGFDLRMDETKTLLGRGLRVYDLNLAALGSALVGSCRPLLLPGFTTLILNDHLALWSWCGELLVGAAAWSASTQRDELQDLLKTTLHASLARCQRPVKTKQEAREQYDQLRTALGHHAQNHIQSSSLISAYLSFPLLEGVLKRACHSYVGMDGSVVAEFARADGSKPSYKVGKRCSSLNDLLALHRSCIACSDLGGLIDEFRLHFEAAHPGMSAFSRMYEWRNQSLHGTTHIATIGALVLNYALLIAIFELAPCFESRRVDALTHVSRCVSSGLGPSPLTMYPPNC